MKSNKINLAILKIIPFLLLSSIIQAEIKINILPIDVIGSDINEQSYISGVSLSDELIRFNSIKSKPPF